MDSTLPRFDVDQALTWVTENVENAGDREGPFYPWWDGGFRSQEPSRIVDQGWGLCSDKVAVLTDIALSQGIDARSIGLNGHVVAELEVEPGKWRLIDPAYELIFPASYEELTTTHTHLLYEKYASEGSTVPAMFLSTADNTIYSSALINAERSAIEAAKVAQFHDTFLQIGLISCLTLVFAGALAARALKRKTSGRPKAESIPAMLET
jgi:hypothetical protein